MAPATACGPKRWAIDVFARARRRLAIRYLLLFLVVLVVFSGVFLVALAVALQPAFDIAPEIADDEMARRAYARTLEAIVVSLALADVFVLAVVGAAGYYLADRTLRPIREAHDRQRRFVADASHEMRTPIAAIRSTAESVLMSTSPVAGAAALARIVGSTERLTRLTHDLLVLASSERGSLRLVRDELDLSVVTAEAVEQLRTDGAHEGSTIAVSLASDLIVRGHPDDLGRIVANLIDNALRYGGGIVRVRTLELDGQAIVEVADEGPGIAESDLGRIFEPFFRVRSDAGAPSGSGLGLAIAAELARQQGGRLTVESRPGLGSTFRLGLPRFR